MFAYLGVGRAGQYASPMRILGVNAYMHDAGLALVEDARTLFASEEERFNRIRKTREFPAGAIARLRYDLDLDLEEVDCVAFPWHPLRYLRMALQLCFGRFPPACRLMTQAASPHANAPAWFRIVQVARDVAVAFDRQRPPSVQFVRHHLAHACGAYFRSPFDEAAILIMDGYGDGCSTSCHIGRGGKIETLHSNHALNSLGILYSLVTMHLGYRSVHDEGKVMAMAAHGTDALLSDFRKLVQILPCGQYRLVQEYFSFQRYGEVRPFSDRYLERFGPFRRHDEPVAQRHMDIAFALQQTVADTIVHVARELRRTSGMRNLCFGGGVALNCLANSRLVNEAGFDRVHVSYSPGDSGAAEGAALAAAHFRSDISQAIRANPNPSPYVGPEFSDREIRAALEERGAVAVVVEDPAGEGARRIAEGECIAWFQGRAEVGPRALGNRSILANPRDAAVRVRLNQEVKRREWFRPFAPTVLPERAARFFDSVPASPYMSFAAMVRPEVRAEIPAVVADDGSARVQSLEPEGNPLFRRLIEQFEERTGIPMVLNTSFNVRSPMVGTPGEAIDTFRSSGLDALIIGSHVVSRNGQAKAASAPLPLSPPRAR